MDELAARHAGKAQVVVIVVVQAARAFRREQRGEILRRNGILRRRAAFLFLERRTHLAVDLQRSCSAAGAHRRVETRSERVAVRARTVAMRWW